MRSRRFPNKYMVMGVEGQPKSDKDFDGGLLVETVSKIHLIKKTAHQCLSGDIIISSERKWSSLFLFFIGGSNSTVR